MSITIPPCEAIIAAVSLVSIPPLPRLLLDGGFGLRELTPLARGLEEIFLSVVREAGEAETRRKAAAAPAARREGAPS